MIRMAKLAHGKLILSSGYLRCWIAPVSGLVLTTSNVVMRPRVVSLQRPGLCCLSSHFTTLSTSPFTASSPQFASPPSTIHSTSLRYASQRMPPSEEENKRRMEEAYREFQEGFRELRSDLATVPNAISLCRLMSSAVIGPLVLMEEYVPALILFTAAGISDVADGYIARNWPGQASVSGTFLDPVADKVLLAVTTICLSAVDLMPIALTLTIIGRDTILVVGGSIIRYAALPEPKNKAAFFNLDLKIKPNILSKVTTFFQIMSVIGALGAPVFGYLDHFLLTQLYLWTAGITFASGISYAFRPGTIDAVTGKHRPRM